MLCRSCWLYLLPHHGHLDIQPHQHYINLSFTKCLFRTKLFIFRDSSCLGVRITLEAKSSRRRVTRKISSRHSPCSIKYCGSAIHSLKRSFGVADQVIELTLSKKLSNSTSAFPQALMFPQVNYTNLCQSFEFFMQQHMLLLFHDNETGNVCLKSPSQTKTFLPKGNRDWQMFFIKESFASTTALDIIGASFRSKVSMEWR